MKLLIALLIFYGSLVAVEPIKIVYNVGTPPLKFTDKNKKANGMLIEIWKLWAKKNNIAIKFIPASWDDSIQMIKDGRAHIHAGIYYTKERDKFLDYTAKSLYKNKKYFFYNSRILDVTSKEDLLPFVIGIDNGYPNRFMKENFPHFAVKNYKSADETSAAMINGDVKVILSSLHSFMYYLNNNNIDKNRFKFSESTLVYTKEYYGVVKEGNSKLLSIIDQGFEKITEKELRDIELKWTNQIQNIKSQWIKKQVKQLISNHILHNIIIVILLILFVIIYWNRKLKIEIEQRKKIELELQTQQQQLKDANNTKSEFLAKMSHEIRTPMNAVLGMLYLIQKTKLSTIQESYISKANSAANSLLAIIDDILDFSKIEAGKLVIENKEFNLNDMIYENMDIMSFKAQNKGCELLANYDSSIPTIIKSDKVRIGQILNNLVSNAIKFTDNGEIVVSSKLIKQENSIATIMFCIKDSGIGISKEDQNKLFKNFSQADNSITRKFGGTGLGLVICEKLANLLGGKIWLEESKEQVGSTFCFTIKCEVSENTTIKPFVFPKEFHNTTILVVDDNIMACDILKGMLTSFGFAVTIAYNGEEAYDLIINQNKNYDLVFLDYKMPKLNGIQTYEKIKISLKEQTPKTVMITAYSQDEILEQITKLGIDHYLIKPTSPSKLYNTILEVLNPNAVEEISLLKHDQDHVTNLKGIKILLAEDNELNQDFAKELLQGVNISVDIAFDGKEALSLIKTKEYDAILMDIQMPNLDGLSATKLIREMGKENQYFLDIPIIALSANALTQDRQKSIEAGMNEHISKPIIPQELFDTLKKFLKEFKPVTIKQNDTLSTQINTINNDIIDIKEALQRMGGNESAYIKLLKQFELKYQKAFEDIEALHQAKDYQKLKNKIHEIKGITGNLSVNRLFNTLLKIEKLLKNKELPSVKLLEVLKFDFEHTFKEISTLNNQKSEYKVFDKEKVVALLDTIQTNLENDIVVCENSFEKLAPYLQKEYTAFSDNLSQALDEFDTDSAFNLIENFLKDLENG
jgi:signal transduction histidine kinase/CheY-like chemotaxis protein